MEKHEAHVRYSAEEYDRYTAAFVKPFDDMLAARVVEEAAARPPGVVLLDVGTGTGRLLLHLARIEELKGLRLVGTDVFPDMLDRARQGAAEAGLQNRIEFLLQDVHSMELPDDFADIVLSRSTLHHWRQPVVALSQIHRVLKPSGIAIIHDVRRDPAPEAIAEFNRLRAGAGLGPSFLDEKYTTAEASQFLQDANLVAHTTIHATSRGLEGLGFAIEITKPLLLPLTTGPH